MPITASANLDMQPMSAKVDVLTRMAALVPPPPVLQAQPDPVTTTYWLLIGDNEPPTVTLSMFGL
jgi:hypothetical protein